MALNFITLKSVMLKHCYLMGSSEIPLAASYVIKQGNQEGVATKLIFLSCTHSTPTNT
jgi:hypothetical protein